MSYEDQECAPKPDGGPAFPYSALTPEGPNIYGDSQGMSLRDWFAGLALPLLHPQQIIVHGEKQAEPQEIEERFTKAISKASYQIADTMISERRRA